jgi:3'(2'), 5'-bisphosphate nucleotidase
MIEYPPLIEIARRASLEAGKAILAIYASGDFGTGVKADLSPLTLADKAAHDLIHRHLISTGLPVLSEEGAQVPYEERRKWEDYWLVDPLDGTKEFINRNGKFTVNIALMRKNVPAMGVIYAPCLETIYFGSKETGVFIETEGKSVPLLPLTERKSLDRLLLEPKVTVIASRSHLSPETQHFMDQFRQAPVVTMGSSLKLMLLAENKADVYPRLAPTMEWDTAAGHAILNALNRGIYRIGGMEELEYNKPNLLNPSFVSF